MSLKSLLPLCLVLAATMPASAALRSSATYNVTTESLDGAGEPGTSASYSSVSSAGGFVDVGTAGTPSETLKPGYVGQLYQVTGLAVTGASSVNETATLQLAAWESLDDGTQIALATNAVSWSVASGPLTSVSTTGVATAGAVYQNTMASAAASALGFAATFSFTVIDTLTDNYGSYAGDGLPDAWQVQYFGLNNPLAAPTADADGTGQDNLFKYNAGLDPTNPSSRFIVSLQSVTGQPGLKQIVFGPRYGTSTYTVQYSYDLLNWNTLGGTVSDAGTQRTLTDIAAAGARKFYRISITKP